VTKRRAHFQPHGFEVRKAPPPEQRAWVPTVTGPKMARLCALCRKRYTGPMIEHLKECSPLAP
jgi:hypothetical protein